MGGAGNNNIIRGNWQGYFSEDAVACNGIILAVNRLILPGVGFNNRHCGGGTGSKGGKGGEGGKGGYYGGSYGGLLYGGKGSKGNFRRELVDREDTVFEEDEDNVEDEVVIGEGTEEEESSVVPQQDEEQQHRNTFEKRSQRRKRFLETLINPNGEI